MLSIKVHVVLFIHAMQNGSTFEPIDLEDESV